MVKLKLTEGLSSEPSARRTVQRYRWLRPRSNLIPLKSFPLEERSAAYLDAYDPQMN